MSGVDELEEETGEGAEGGGGEDVQGVELLRKCSASVPCR